jgi:recombination protein RecT
MPDHNEIVPVKERAQAKLVQLRDLFTKAAVSMNAVATRHLTPEKLTKVALVAIGKSPDLLDCDSHSILQCVMTAAQLGLDCSGVLGSAYLVPFKGKATLIIGYRGLIDLARRSGEIDTIEAHVVREKDKFDIAFGLEPKLVHVPDLSADPGAAIIFYAIARLKDGGRQVEVMTRAEVDAIRKRSRASSSGPWVTDYDEMGKKTVIRRLTKTLPLTAELASALAAEDEGEGFAEIIPPDRTPMMMPKEIAAAPATTPVPEPTAPVEAPEPEADPIIQADEPEPQDEPQAPAPADFMTETVRKIVTKKREGKSNYYLIDTEGGSTLCCFRPDTADLKPGDKFRVTKEHAGTNGPVIDEYERVP